MWIASASVPVAAAERLDGERDAPPARRSSYSSSNTAGCKRRAAGDDRTGAELVLGHLPELDARLVGGEGDVDDDRHVGVQANALVREPANVVSSWATASASTSPGRRRRRPPGAPPRRRRSSRCGCPASARRAGRWRSSTGSASITPTSPIRTSSRASSASSAPMSMCRSLISGARSRSSALSRWIGLRPITPTTSPPRVAEADALADEQDRIPAADLAEAQETLDPRCA